MRCNVCGRLIQNEEANFCEYCGSSFREQKQNSFHTPPREQGLPYGNGAFPPVMQMQSGTPDQERPVTFLNWLASYGIMFIPFVGWLIFLVMLLVWSFNDSTPQSKKNWARATLIFSVVMFVFAVVMLTAMVTSSPMYQDMMQQMQNGTFDYNSFYQEWMQKTY